MGESVKREWGERGREDSGREEREMSDVRRG